jgi:MOSC domain-containing protein YiiM
VIHLATADLEAGLDEVRAAPAGAGRLELIVRRPGSGEREVVEEALLDLEEGLVGDTWRARGSRSRPDGSADPDKQVTVMSARAAALVAGDRARWALAGDQLYVDLDVSVGALPAGSLLRVGGAVIEVSEAPHRGCAKFAGRFGEEAVRFCNSPVGLALRFRGLNAGVVVPGTIRVGDEVSLAGRDVALTPGVAAPAGRTGG